MMMTKNFIHVKRAPSMQGNAMIWLFEASMTSIARGICASARTQSPRRREKRDVGAPLYSESGVGAGCVRYVPASCGANSDGLTACSNG